MSAIVDVTRMSITIEERNGEHLDEWNSYVDRSSHALPFHRRSALESIAAHSDHELHPLVGYKGQEPIGLFPLFETTMGPFTVVSSPPIETGIAYMGPLELGLNGAKQRNVEKTRRRFVQGALEWIETELEPDLIQIRCTSGYTDVRPFLWEDFEVTPTYTYTLPLGDDPDELLSSFSSDARANIRQFDASECTVEVGGYDDLGTLNEQVRSRLAEKGLDHNLSTAFLEELYEELGPDRVRPYVCVREDEIVGGVLVLREGGTVYGWIGGTVPSVDAPVNEGLDWAIIRDGIEEGLDRYDLHGAMERGVTEYKSKFNPELTPLYEIERKSSGAKAASGLLDQMPNSISSLIN
ncbi:Acetyltransferase (GNAT) domain-containing protein [Natrinema salifodinae]|uniref:Acetyltransferase (GNAT) domain-containing protein n=2 Tax=Natrinema salifodinae TaxID=1202768 RepID=A0A1I0LYU2_9EURY|nr:Acetyltransferase (GNAT) domain-containing protein [Natrinema salifodinae]